MAMIDQLAQTIATFEGFYNSPAQNAAGGSSAQNPAQRNNNPGNLKGSPYAIGTDAQGFSIFASPEQGFQALDYQLGLYASRGMDLSQVFAIYDPNNSANYLNYVTSQLGVGPSTSMSALYDSTPATTASVPSPVPTDTGAIATDTVGLDISGGLLSSLTGSTLDGSAGNGGGGVPLPLLLGGLVGLIVLYELFS